MKITIRQTVNGNKDPVLTITITNHPAYLRDHLVCDEKDDAMLKIGRWIRNKLLDSDKRTSLENDPSQIRRGGEGRIG
jgi:hypothetical protein